MIKEIRDEILYLYTKQQFSVFTIAKKVNYSPTQVWRIVKMYGKTRKRGARRINCVDCGVLTTGRSRCPFHTKIRNAMMNLECVKKYKKRIKQANRR